MKKEYKPYEHLMPNQKDNTIRLTKAQEERQDKKRGEISAQLKISLLKDKILNLTQVFLIHSDKFFNFEESISEKENKESLLKLISC